jgi:hypothetical protein
MKEKHGHGHMMYRAGSPNPSGLRTCIGAGSTAAYHRAGRIPDLIAHEGSDRASHPESSVRLDLKEKVSSETGMSYRTLLPS